MNYPKVSIIIPTYNMEKFVCDAIDSALNQTYPNCEIILVDDGSTDNTLKIIREQFNDKTPRNNILILQKKNGGTASALNLGLRHSTGDWIHWLSADDKLLPSGIEKMIISILDTSDNQNCIFYSNYYKIDKDGEKIGEFVEPNRNSLSIQEQGALLLQSYFGNGTTSMIHKSVFERFGFFDETIPYFEDYEFWLRASLVNKLRFVLVPEFTAMYRFHESQISKTVDMSWNEKIKQKVLGKI